MRTVIPATLIALLLLFTATAFAADNFMFDEITGEDWAITQDSARGIHDACMIFEKIVMNDKKLVDDDCYYTIYRRFRVLTEDGKEFGDVFPPLFSRKQEIEAIKGRTIRADGDTVYLKEEHIFEKDVYKNKYVSLKQKSFSMPGLSDDCIFEYYIKMKIPGTAYYWIVQKDIPVLNAELTWFVFRGAGMNKKRYNFLSEIVEPSYLFLRLENNLLVQKLPDTKDINKIIFTGKDIPAFKHEPFSLPEFSLKGQLRYYYSENEGAGSYWSRFSKNSEQWREFYLTENIWVDRLGIIFDQLPTREEKIQAAYEWVADSLKNIRYLPADEEVKFKEHYYADDSYKSGYASNDEMNYFFAGILNEMGIDAKICYVVDRDDDLFVKDAKYYQFDNTVVLVYDSAHNATFYAPNEPYMPFGMVPWYNEGITALISGDFSQLYHTIPFSKSAQNKTIRNIRATINDEYTLTTRTDDTLTGHNARSIRLLVDRAEGNEQVVKLNEYLTNRFHNPAIDSIDITGRTSTKEPLTLSYKVGKFDLETALVGDRLILQPVMYMEYLENPFTNEKRQNHIIFSYADQTTESFELILPENWATEGIPDDIEFKNKCGSCSVHFSADNNILTVTRSIELKKPFFSAKDYDQVKSFFEKLISFNDLTVAVTTSM